MGLRTKSHGMVSDEQERVVIGQDRERYFQVGSQLPSSEKVAFVKFLEDNNDVFAWSTYDVPEIDPEFICQQLNVNLKVTPRRQLPQCSSKEHVEVVREVNKLKQVEAIKEIILIPQID